MRVIVLMICLVLCTASAFSQTVDRVNAQLALRKGEEFIGSGDFKNAELALANSKLHIDKAYSINSTDIKVLLLRSQIYSTLPLLKLDKAENQLGCLYNTFKPNVNVSEAVKEQDVNFDIVLTSFEKSLKSPGITLSLKEDVFRNLAKQHMYFYSCAAQSYMDKDYAAALRFSTNAIRASHIIGKVDTLSKWAQTLSYESLRDYPNAIKGWKDLIALKYRGADSYKSLANVYFITKMNSEAEAIIAEAKKHYPKDF